MANGAKNARRTLTVVVTAAEKAEIERRAGGRDRISGWIRQLIVNELAR